MLPRQTLLAVILAVSVFASGCLKQAVKTMSDLQAVHDEITKKFGDAVHINLNDGPRLTITVTFFNSPLNDKTREDRENRAVETAQIVRTRYARSAEVQEVWVAFLREKTRFAVFHYREGLDVFGFDKEGRPLGLGREDKPSPFSTRASSRFIESTNESDISVDGLQLEGQPGGNKGLVVLPHFKVAGDVRKGKAKPPKEVAFDFASYSDKQEFAQTTRITFLGDGQPILKTNGTFSGTSTQFCYVVVPYPTFRRMIAASTLTLKLGDKEYPLTPSQLERLQQMTLIVQE
jgi:hypothetical protein